MMNYEKGKDFPGRKSGTGAKAKPNNGSTLLNRSTEEIRTMVRGKMGHPMKTGMSNPA